MRSCSLLERPRLIRAHWLARRTSWLIPGRLAASRYPEDIERVAGMGFTLVINLAEQAHEPNGASGVLRHLHLPVPDYLPPTREQIDEGCAAIAAELAAGGRVLVHCQAGLGRTGTLLACYLVSGGRPADEAIREVRRVRPGSIETAAQEQAVREFASTTGNAA